MKNWSYSLQPNECQIGLGGWGDQTITLAQDHPQWWLTRQNVRNAIPY